MGIGGSLPFPDLCGMSVRGDYEPGMPVCGFMFPAFKDRGPDNGRIQVFEADPARPHRDFLRVLLPVSAK